MIRLNGTIVRLLIVLVHVSTASALLCLSCQSISNIRDCLTLEECGSNQICYSNRFTGADGKALYTVGCIDDNRCNQTIQGKRETHSGYDLMDSDPETRLNDDLKRSDPTCLECCTSSDGCNKDLCGASSSPNLRCLICRDVLETKYCNKFTECGQDQLCFVQRTVNSVSSKLQYEMDCMGFQQCNGLDKSDRQDCATCCNGTDYCNYDACDNWTPSNVSVSTTSAPVIPTKTTVMPTTIRAPTTPGATAPSGQLVLEGPTNSSYLSRVELKCITLPSAQAYIWGFNGTLTLPQGVTVEAQQNLIGISAGLDKLIITELNELTAGMYSCSATIDGHTLQKNHHLSIRKERPTAHIAKTLVPPYFALVCNTTGYPPPQIGWAFVKKGPNTGSVDLPADADVTLKGRVSIVVVANYRPAAHDGSWYCAARNNIGDVIAEIEIP